MIHRAQIRTAVLDAFTAALTTTGNAGVYVGRIPQLDIAEQVIPLGGRGGKISSVTWGHGVHNETDAIIIGFQLLTTRRGVDAATAEARYFELVGVLRTASGLWPEKAISGPAGVWSATIGDVTVEDPELVESVDNDGVFAQGAIYLEITVDLTDD